VVKYAAMLPTESQLSQVPAERGSRAWSWENFSSLDGNFGQHVTENPLIVVHPGYCVSYNAAEIENTVANPRGIPYWVDRVDRTILSQKKTYKDYMSNLRQKIQTTLQEDRTLIILAERDYLDETLKIIGFSEELPKGIVVVPTKTGGPAVDPEILDNQAGQNFYNNLANSITRAEICGESGLACVVVAEKWLKNLGVEVSRIRSCTEPDYQSE